MPFLPRRFLAVDGVMIADQLDLGEHLLADGHWEAAAFYYATADAAPIGCFAGFEIAGFQLATRIEQLEAWPRIARSRSQRCQ